MRANEQTAQSSTRQFHAYAFYLMCGGLIGPRCHISVVSVSFHSSSKMRVHLNTVYAHHAFAMHVLEARKTMTQDKAKGPCGDAILIWPQAMKTTTMIKLKEQGIALDGECKYRLYSIQRFLDAS